MGKQDRGPPGRGRIHATIVGDHIEVRLTRGFTAADLAHVRGLAGRRWDPDRSVWMVPRTPGVIDALRRAFGDRLVVHPPMGGSRAAGPDSDSSAAGEAGGRAAGGVDGDASAAGGRQGDASAVGVRQGDAGDAVGIASTDAAGGAAASVAAVGQGDGDGSTGAVDRASASEAAEGQAAAAGTGVEPRGTHAGTPAPDIAALTAALRRVLRLREYSRRTERAYVAWVERFVRFVGLQASVGPGKGGPPVPVPASAAAGAPDAAGPSCTMSAGLDETAAIAFLEHLAQSGLAARSRNQAASALHFLFREVLECSDDLRLPRARGPVRMPLVLTHGEVLRVLTELSGKYQLIGMLLYSSGLRIGECLSLRIKDIDFELQQILVRDGKGHKDRYVPLARRAMQPLRVHIRRVLELHAHDRARGHGWAPLPGALHRKDPAAGYEPGWQFIFPASTINADPATGATGRRPLHTTAAERAFKTAVRRSGITKRATCHTLRHSFATETLRSGCDIRKLQAVMGHRDLKTTASYLHVVEQSGLTMRSPLDRPAEYDEYGWHPIADEVTGLQRADRVTKADPDSEPHKPKGMRERRLDERGPDGTTRRPPPNPRA